MSLASSSSLHEEEPVSDGDPVGDAVDGDGVDGHVGAGAEGGLAEGPRADGEEAVEQPQASYYALGCHDHIHPIELMALMIPMYFKEILADFCSWNSWIITRGLSILVSLQLSMLVNCGSCAYMRLIIIPQEMQLAPTIHQQPFPHNNK